MTTKHTILLSLFFLSINLQTSKSKDPTPTPWPHQFHSILFQRINDSIPPRLVDFWYDWPNGRTYNIIQYQLGRTKYDVEWNNGTSFVFYTDENECEVNHFPVGILRPNWLDGATYVGQEWFDGRLCYVWTKVDFIRYYEDVVTRRPVYWIFYDGIRAHVMTFEVGAVLEDSYWQAPFYCFDETKEISVVGSGSKVRLRDVSSPSMSML